MHSKKDSFTRNTPDMVNHDRVDTHLYTIRTCKKRRDWCWRVVNAVQVEVVEVQLLSIFLLLGRDARLAFYRVRSMLMYKTYHQKYGEG
jgi:hypothetical protein